MIITESVGDKKCTNSWIFSRDPSRFFKIAAVVCPNPFCRCSEVELRFLDTTMEDECVFSITVDVLTQKPIKVNTEGGNKEPDEPAKLFMDEVNDADWLKLYQMFYAIKASNIETYDYENNTYGLLPIDIEDKETSNALLGYSEIFPYGTQIMLNIGDVSYLLDEQFCPRRDCTCTQVSLGVFLIIDGKTSGDEQIFILDYKSRQMVALSILPDGFPSAKELLQAFRENPATTFGQIQKRHSRIKLVYRKYKEQLNWIDESVQGSGGRKIRIGRNQPCPCGSGLKYKRCCG